MKIYTIFRDCYTIKTFECSSHGEAIKIFESCVENLTQILRYPKDTVFKLVETSTSTVATKSL